MENGKALVFSAVTSVPISVAGHEQSATFDWKVENLQELARSVEKCPNRSRRPLPYSYSDILCLAELPFEMVKGFYKFITFGTLDFKSGCGFVNLITCLSFLGLLGRPVTFSN